jgi:penicillin-binding protein 2
VLLGKYPSDEEIAATQRGQSTVPIGEQRDAASVPLPGAPATLPPAAAPDVVAASASGAAASAPARARR